MLICISDYFGTYFLYSRDNIPLEELRASMLRQEALTSGLLKMFRGMMGADKVVNQVMNKRLSRALFPNGSFVHQSAAPGSQESLLDQEILASMTTMGL